MTIYKRFLLLFFGIVLFLTILVSHHNTGAESTRIRRHRFPTTHAGEPAGEQDEVDFIPPQQVFRDASSYKNARDTAISSDTSPFLPGKVKPYGSNYTKAVVIGHISSEDVTWLEDVSFPPHVSKYIYDADPKSRPPTSIHKTQHLSLPRPKGHEAMVYLTYIIDHYDELADVNLFLHAHRLAWHNDEMLNHDAVEVISRLSAERVVREGYMNLRCHWKPGCPEYIYPGAVRVDEEKKEEGAMAAAWGVLFPGDPVPQVIAAPCCAQFAVSRERIRSVPRERYELYRDWLLDTRLDDHVSGRVFEYLWHKIFTGLSSLCPDMRVCYCDGYGLCFEDEVEFDYWFELRWKKRRAEQKLEQWKLLVERVERQKNGQWSSGRKAVKGSDSEVPAVNGDVLLQSEIRGYAFLLEESRLNALQAGTDPRVRARLAGRVWKDGDGY